MSSAKDPEQEPNVIENITTGTKPFFFFFPKAKGMFFTRKPQQFCQFKPAADLVSVFEVPELREMSQGMLWSFKCTG